MFTAMTMAEPASRIIPAIRASCRWIGSVALSGYQLVIGLLSLLLIPVLSVYLLKDIDVLRERLADLVPPARRERVLAPLAPRVAVGQHLEGANTDRLALGRGYGGGGALRRPRLGLLLPCAADGGGPAASRAPRAAVVTVTVQIPQWDVAAIECIQLIIIAVKRPDYIVNISSLVIDGVRTFI